ncbi:chorismate lyase [Microbulbifer rhizosphaerae]|uniref:Probable chorismate pyruvate-lyase n=1 Tax=Microbulbifer rhizosphaerae TaxID=1562603 RepID=A0A7W4WCJ5_9GAMM|nr:chorismate--pyruvate lyase [Microbulbifer rhizosphaerae]
MLYSPPGYQSPYEPDGAWLSQPLETLQGKGPPAELLPWLLYPGSLTAALKHLSAGDFRVQVLSQRWQQPGLEERRALDMRERQRALVREVLLYGNGRTWVYARSVLPERSLQGRSRYLRSLDNRPLGELLFSQPDIRRGPIALNRLRRNSRCRLRELAGEGASAWGRRSTFWLRDKPLLVAEAFLDGFRPQHPPFNSSGGKLEERDD